jgi:RecJ-like exonuclease
MFNELRLYASHFTYPSSRELEALVTDHVASHAAQRSAIYTLPSGIIRITIRSERDCNECSGLSDQQYSHAPRAIAIASSLDLIEHQHEVLAY